MALASSQLPRLLITSALILAPGAALAAPASPAATVDTSAVKGESMTKDHKDLAAAPATCAAAAVQPDEVASDPEEGGQVARTAKPALTEIKVVKTSDKASTTLMQSPAAPPPAC